MRKARRKQQRANALDVHALLAQQEASEGYHMSHTISKVPQTKHALSLTLPALPARQLPRRSKRIVQHQGTTYQPDYKTVLLSDYPMTQAMAKDVSEGLKLPEIVHDQHPSLATQRSSFLMRQHQLPLSTVGWKPVHATGGIQERFT